MSGGINAKFEFEACRKFALRSAETAFDTAHDKLRAENIYTKISLYSVPLR